MLHERGINICHETVRLWWNELGIVSFIDGKTYQSLKRHLGTHQLRGFARTIDRAKVRILTAVNG